MTRARVQALQALQPPRPLQMVRCTVTAVATSAVTVQLPGGGTVAGLRVTGCTYTVGAAAMVLLQEPAVGPVYPIS